MRLELVLRLSARTTRRFVRLSTANAVVAALAAFVALFVLPLGPGSIRAHAAASPGPGWLEPVQLDVVREADVPAFPYGLVQCTDTGDGCVIGGFNLTKGTVHISSGEWVPVWPRGVMPVPATIMGLQLHGGIFGSYVDIHRDVLGHLEPVYAPWPRVVEMRLAKPADARLRDTAGRLLQARGDSMSFSSNGRWLVFDDPGVSHVRVDLETFETLQFGPPADYGIGLDPAYRTAVSNDGRFVAINQAYRGSGIRVYDLGACVPPAPGQAGHQCQHREFSNAIRQQVPGYMTAIPREFIDEQTLVVYASSVQAGIGKYTRLLVKAGGMIPPPLDYLGLGDSYSAGEGTFDYRSGTDVHPSAESAGNLCHNSFESYPYRIAAERSIDPFASVACSGAVVSDLTGTRQYEGDGTEALTSFLPGVRPQIDFVSLYRPRVVTVGIGGNGDDRTGISLGDVAKRCVLGPDTCYDTYAERLQLLRDINSRFDALIKAFAGLRSTGTANPRRVFVIGYPQIFSGSACQLNVRLNDGERAFVELYAKDLNSVIAAAAEKAGILYVDVEDAFEGHRLCEGAGPFAVNGLTAGDDVRVPLPAANVRVLGNESYHPTKYGQQLLAQAVLARANFDDAEIPQPKPSFTAPAESSSNLLRGLNPTPVAPGKWSWLGPLVTYLDATYPISLEGALSGLARSAAYEVVLHSDPVALGTVTTDDRGNLSATVKIPPVVEPGWHELHLQGTDVFGLSIDLSQSVYVAATPEDLNANGVPDTDEPCGLLGGASVDEDRDSIDDACDPLIDEPPVDAVAPIVVAHLSELPNGAGWHSSTVTVSLTASDGLGGTGVKETIYTLDGATTVVSGDAATVVIAAEGVHELSFHAVDNRGNASHPATLTIKVDKSSPIVTCSSPEPAWHASNVAVACVASDGRSGLRDASDKSFTLETTVADGDETPRAETGTREICDVSGNCAIAGPIRGIRIDRKAPVLRLPPPPSVDASTTRGAVVTFAVIATDGADTNPTVVCAPASGSVFSIGQTSVECTASDLAGNKAAGSFLVTVRRAVDPQPPARPKAAERCVVPRVVGMPLVRARRAIRIGNCSVGRITYALSKRRKGVVISQNPHPGRKLKVRARVNLIASRGRK